MPEGLVYNLNSKKVTETSPKTFREKMRGYNCEKSDGNKDI